MRLGLIYLGRRGAGAPISYELGTHLSHHADVLAVLSEYVENLNLWQNTDLELIITSTYRSLPGALWSWFNQFKFKRLADRIRSWQPDALIFPMFYTWNPFLQWHMRDIISIVAVHDPIPHPGLTGYAYKLLEDFSIRNAERCLIFSKELAPELAQRGTDLQRVDYIPLGEMSYYQRYMPQTPPQDNSEIPKLLFFGRITAYKGIDTLLLAYKEIRYEQKCELMIVGEGDLNPYKSLLDDLPEVKIINQWISEEDIAALFNQASILLLPYISGSQSGVLPIAASFGLPVIATDVGGIPEQIEHENTGLLVKPGSVPELVDATQRLIKYPDFARRLGENLQRDFRENKNWKTIAEVVFNVCEKAVHQNLT